MSQTDVFLNANCPVLEWVWGIFGSKLVLTDDRRTDNDRRTENLERNTLYLLCGVAVPPGALATTVSRNDISNSESLAQFQGESGPKL